jgi:hypothetical protein
MTLGRGVLSGADWEVDFGRRQVRKLDCAVVAGAGFRA